MPVFLSLWQWMKTRFCSLDTSHCLCEPVLIKYSLEAESEHTNSHLHQLLNTSRVTKHPKVFSEFQDNIKKSNNRFVAGIILTQYGHGQQLWFGKCNRNVFNNHQKLNCLIWKNSFVVLRKSRSYASSGQHSWADPVQESTDEPVLKTWKWKTWSNPSAAIWLLRGGRNALPSPTCTPGRKNCPGGHESRRTAPAPTSGNILENRPKSHPDSTRENHLCLQRDG